MRAAPALLPILLLAAACATPAEPRAPGLAGYLHILQAARNERQACAVRGPDCAGDMEDSLARAEAEAPRGLFLPAGQAAAERPLAEAALQAAHMDCRTRGVSPGTRRWDTCRVDRGIARLNEVAGLQ